MGDEGCRALSQLLRERLFLTSMVHALEEQRTFTLHNKSGATLHKVVSYLMAPLIFPSNVMVRGSAGAWWPPC